MSFEHSKIELIMRLRAEGVRNTKVLEALEKVPREIFLPSELKFHAYDDNALPIECGQTISQPFLVGLMTNRLNLTDRSKVLEIGTGSGYQTAILSYLCRRVYTIERFHSMARRAEKRFQQLQRRNITTMTGDGTKGWPAQAPFDRILVTAAAERHVPKPLLEQLAIGGEMIIPIGYAPNRQELRRIMRTEHGYDTERMFPVKFVPLLTGIAKDD